MLSPTAAVTILRSLRPLTRVTTPAGAVGEVMAQLRNKVTVRVGREVIVYERHELEVEVTDAALRGHGRFVYRGGGTVDDAVTFAADQVGRELTALERMLVCDGWAAERAEVAL